MSDTPIDQSLTEKKSTRYPSFLDRRIETFRAAYNDEMESALDGDALDVFTLDSHSDARRRLIEMGLRHYQKHGLPYGFAFDPDTLADDDIEEPSLRCPTCGNTDPEQFRAAANHDGSIVTFTELTCLACGEPTTADVAISDGSGFFS